VIQLFGAPGQLQSHHRHRNPEFPRKRANKSLVGKVRLDLLEQMTRLICCSRQYESSRPETLGCYRLGATQDDPRVSAQTRRSGCWCIRENKGLTRQDSA